MAGPTQPLVSLHGAGRNDTYGAALLDVAQDHVLWMLDQQGLFESGELVFKGGTSLRKCRLGNAGRFSTDLDFACADGGDRAGRLRAIDGQSVGGFAFSLERRATMDGTGTCDVHAVFVRGGSDCSRARVPRPRLDGCPGRTCTRSNMHQTAS